MPGRRTPKRGNPQWGWFTFGGYTLTSSKKKKKQPKFFPLLTTSGGFAGRHSSVHAQIVRALRLLNCVSFFFFFLKKPHTHKNHSIFLMISKAYNSLRTYSLWREERGNIEHDSAFKVPCRNVNQGTRSMQSKKKNVWTITRTQNNNNNICM